MSVTTKARVAVALATLEALVISAEDLLGKATELAPVDEGDLRASGTVVIIVNGSRFEGTGAAGAARSAVSAIVAAGQPVAIDAEVSFNTVYAARQHEELDWLHPKGGQAKYLDEPLRANGDRYARVIALAASNAL